MKKKLLSMLLVGAMVLGCGTAAFAEEVDMNDDGTINNPEAVEIADGSLSMWSLFTGGDGEWFKEIADAYNGSEEAKMPVQVVTLVWADYYTKLQTAVATGNGPDIGVSHVSKLYELADTGVVEPITDYLEELDIDLSQYFSQTSIDSVTFDDEIYAIPLDTHSEIMYYNTDLLADAGITEEDVLAVKSAEEFDALLEKCKEVLPEDCSVISLASQGDDAFRLWYALYFQMGGTPFVNDGATEVTLDEDIAKAAMEYLKSWFDKGYVLPGIDKDEHAAFFQSGKAAFIFAGTWVTGNFTNTEGLNFGLTTFPLLYGDTPYCWSDSHTLTIPVNPDRTEEETLAAVDFIFNASTTYGLSWAGSGQIPSATTVNGSEEYAAMPGYAAVKELDYSVYAPLATNYYGGMKADIIEALEAYLADGDVDAGWDGLYTAIEANLD